MRENILRETGEPDKPVDEAETCLRMQIKVYQEQQIQVDKVIKDHNDRVYVSFTKMCEAYGLDIDTVRYRLNQNWPLSEALETPLDVHNRPKKCACTDHLNKKYGSISEMCRKYGISRTLYSYRIKLGWTQEDALTIPVNTRKCGRKCKVI